MMSNIYTGPQPEKIMEYPFDEEADELPIITTMNAIQEVIIENIYTFIQDVWPFSTEDEDTNLFI